MIKFKNDIMAFGNFFNKLKGGYLYSDNFNNLCKCLDLSKNSIRNIQKNCKDNEDFDEIISLVYDEIKQEKLNQEFQYTGSLKKYINNFYYEVYIIDETKWEDIKNKLICEINIRKINCFYHLEKSFYDILECDKIWIAKSNILMKVIYYLFEGYSFPESIEHFLIKDIINTFRNNPLCFNEIRKYFFESMNEISYKPSIKLGDFSFNEVHSFNFMVENKALTNFFNELLPYDHYDEYKYLYVQIIHIDGEDYFLLLTIADDNDRGFKLKIWDFSKNYFIHSDLIENNLALFANFDWEVKNKFGNYVNQDFYKIDLKNDKISIKKTDSFNIVTYSNSNICNECIMLEPFVKKDKRYKFQEKNYDKGNIKEIVLEKPFSDEFLELLSLLNLKLSYGYQLQRLIHQDYNHDDIYYLLNRKVLKNENISEDILSKEDLYNFLIDYQIKCILYGCENSWDEIKKDLMRKIDLNIIKSTYDLSLNFRNNQLVKSNTLKKFKGNILKAQIDSLCEFRDVDKNKYGVKLAQYLVNKEIYSNELYKFFDNNLNENYDKMPESLSEAIEYLIVNNSQEFVDMIYNMDKEDMIKFHFTLGMWIRNDFGINGWENEALLGDLKSKLRADGYSSEILYALWDYVQENYDDIIENTEFTNSIKYV